MLHVPMASSAQRLYIFCIVGNVAAMYVITCLQCNNLINYKMLTEERTVVYTDYSRSWFKVT